VSERAVARWLSLAEEDLTMAAPALRQGIYRQVCFHAQQAGEKALKAFLLNRRGTYPKSHSLGQLLLSDVSNDLLEWRDACQRLDLYYLPTRYADALPEGAEEDVTEEEAQAALGDARDVVADIRRRIA
jgi:HEPN domain-containing protein